MALKGQWSSELVFSRCENERFGNSSSRGLWTQRTTRPQWAVRIGNPYPRRKLTSHKEQHCETSGCNPVVLVILINLSTQGSGSALFQSGAKDRAPQNTASHSIQNLGTVITALITTTMSESEAALSGTASSATGSTDSTNPDSIRQRNPRLSPATIAFFEKKKQQLEKSGALTDLYAEPSDDEPLAGRVGVTGRADVIVISIALLLAAVFLYTEYNINPLTLIHKLLVRLLDPGTVPPRPSP